MKKHLYFLLISAILALLFSFSACSGDDVGVTGVTLDKTVTSIHAGSSEKLTAIVRPEDASNKNVSWSSSDASVASVIDGNVSGVKAGQAIIAVTTDNGGHTATCTVTVTVAPAAGIALNKSDMSLAAGSSERLIATVTPPGANQSVVWASDDHNVATVARDGDGTVLATIPGTAAITATTTDGKHTATCVVAVTANVVAVTSVTVVPPLLTLLEDTSDQLIAVVNPPNAPPTNPATAIVWRSSDETKATVSETGIVTAIKDGAVDIIASYGAGENAPKGICALTVIEPIWVTGVTVTPATAEITAGESVWLAAEVAPLNATYPGVTWSTSGDPCVALSADGNLVMVTGQRAGNAIVAVTTTQGGKTAACAVKVNPAPVTGVAISPNKVEVLSGGTALLTANVLPALAENKNVTWETSNASIAAITPSGGACTVTGGTLGATTITVTTEDGAFKGTCAVEVVAALSPVNVYLAGHQNLLDYYGLMLPWNGRSNQLAFLSPDYYDGGANTVFVADNGNRYTGGWMITNYTAATGYYRHPAVWLNASTTSQLLQTDADAGDGEVLSIFASPNNNIYIAGYSGGRSNSNSLTPIETTRPCVWINNGAAYAYTALPTPGYGQAMGIAVSNDGVRHTAGWDVVDGRYRAVYWRDNAPIILNVSGASQAQATSVSVSDDGAVYIAGFFLYEDDHVYGAVWKNGALHQVLEAIEDSWGEGAWSVYAVGGKVYVAGSANIEGYIPAAVLWVDGAATLLDSDIVNKESEASSVFVHNNADVYVTGWVFDYSDYTWSVNVWRNGEIITSTNPSGGLGLPFYNYPMSIFVSNR